MKLVKGLTIDNGGSEVRNLGVNYESLDEILKFRNDFRIIDDSSFRIKDVPVPTSICRVVDAPNPELEVMIGQGITARTYEGISMPITSQNKKTNDINFYRQVVFTIAQDAVHDALSSLEKNGVVKDTDFEYVITSLLPIREVNGDEDCAAKMRSMLSGSYVVEFPLIEDMPQLKFSIRPDWFKVVPEGGIAIMGMGKDLGEDEYSLLIDIGHISTDIGIFEGKNLLGRVESLSCAGNILMTNIGYALADMGYRLNNDQIIRVLETGVVRDGKQEIDVSEIISNQQRIFVRNYLQKEIINLVTSNGLETKQIQNVVPLGAPMNAKDEYTICNEIVKSCGLEKAEIKILAEDLRYVNIMQAARVTKATYKSVMKKYYDSLQTEAV